MESEDPRWFKSSYSEGGNGGCVEVTRLTGAWLIRDSKLGDRSPVLRCTTEAWGAFLADMTAE